jgi:hypothetical protein
MCAWIKTLGSEASRRDAALPKLLDDFTILLSDDKRNPVSRKRFANAAADAAIAYQHDLSGEAGKFDGHRQDRQRIVGAFQRLSKLERDRTQACAGSIA